jgi:hypothetical protein
MPTRKRELSTKRQRTCPVTVRLCIQLLKLHRTILELSVRDELDSHTSFRLLLFMLEGSNLGIEIAKLGLFKAPNEHVIFIKFLWLFLSTIS